MLPFVPFLREEVLFYLGGSRMKEQLEKIKTEVVELDVETPQITAQEE